MDQSLELLGATNFETRRVIQFNRQKLARRTVNHGHAVVWGVQRSHAVDPGIHIPSVKGRKAEHPFEFMVEGIPIVDFAAIDYDLRGQHD
jgi:hypothetical protein